MDTKAYRQVLIEECGEPLAALEGQHLVLTEPHPYVAVGAPYGGENPWRVRASVVAALNRAAEALQGLRPGWKILVFDAYRPVAVQHFMVARELRLLAEKEGLVVEELEEATRERLMAQVLTLWAIPSEDPKTPPPHSTGAALDVTLVDAEGREVDMGGPIDEMGGAAVPGFYAGQATPEGRRYQAHREMLRQILAEQGFERHHEEWWHFSLGDQLWAWLRQQRGEAAVARFGRADLL